MKRWFVLFFLMAGLVGCQRYPMEGEKVQAGQESEETKGEGQAGKEAEGGETDEDVEAGSANPSSAQEQAQEIVINTKPERTPVKVKGIYVSAYVAGMEDLMDEIIAQIDQTELNAVVIDVKDDNGRITFAMDSPSAQEMGACVNYIPDIEALVSKLKEHEIYLIARISTFRDPFLAEVRPDWCCHLADGSVFRDRNKLAWVNPYKKEAWDYLVEIGKKAGEAGFDEIQFDYIRFCTEKGMQKVVFDEADTQGKSRQEIIQEFVEYAYDQLTKEGLFVSADVFGVVMNGDSDASAVGQDYRKMASSLDYICPMIYPSHYSDGYFGIAHPDMQPYSTIAAALAVSKAALAEEGLEPEEEEEREGVENDGDAAGTKDNVGILIEEESKESEGELKEPHQAIVRPWLQDFTASYLTHHIAYGPQQVREQIQAVYDAGYEEWILWDAKVTYHYEGLMPKE